MKPAVNLAGFVLFYKGRKTLQIDIVLIITFIASNYDKMFVVRLHSTCVCQTVESIYTNHFSDVHEIKNLL